MKLDSKKAPQQVADILNALPDIANTQQTIALLATALQLTIMSRATSHDSAQAVADDVYRHMTASLKETYRDRRKDVRS